MALSRDKQILIGVAVLAALSGIVYRQVKQDSQIGSPQASSVTLPEIKGSDDIDKISVTNGDKGEVVLEKKGDKWELTKPVNAPASQSNVKSVLDNLKELKAKEVIANVADEELKKNYALDAAHVVHVVAWKGGEKKVDNLFGKSGGRGQIVMVEGKPAIYAASGYSSYLYAREVKGWRETEVFKFDDANATQLTIENKAGTFSFTKGGEKWAGTFKGQPIERLEEEKVKDAVRAMKFLAAEDFADGKGPEETGLDAPEGTVTVTLKDNAGKYTLKVGKRSSGSSRFAQKEGDSIPIVIGATASDWATATVDKFQQTPDAGAAVKGEAAAVGKTRLNPGDLPR